MTDSFRYYNLRTPNFEGPLELLLSLIEERKFFVNEISLAEVTNDYLAYMKNLKDLDEEKKIENISSFILTAATLMLIKSRSLLPSMTLTKEEKENISDLELRLKLYEIIKKASVNIKNNFGEKIIFSPQERIWSIPIFSATPAVNKENLANLISNLMVKVPKKEKVPEVEIKNIIKIEEVIDDLTNRAQKALQLSFKEFSKSRKTETREEAKVNVIISFLAMLELIREGVIEVMQNSVYDDIKINSLEKA